MVSRPIGTGKYYQRNSHHNTGLTVSFRGTVASEDLWNVYSNGEVFFHSNWCVINGISLLCLNVSIPTLILGCVFCL